MNIKLYINPDKNITTTINIVKWGKKRSNASTSLGVVCISLIKIVSIPKDVYFN